MVVKPGPETLGSTSCMGRMLLALLVGGVLAGGGELARLLIIGLHRLQERPIGPVVLTKLPTGQGSQKSPP